MLVYCSISGREAFLYPRGSFLAALFVKHLNMNLSKKLPITVTFLHFFQLWSYRSVWHHKGEGCTNSFHFLCQTSRHTTINPVIETECDSENQMKFSFFFFSFFREIDSNSQNVRMNIRKKLWQANVLLLRFHTLQEGVMCAIKQLENVSVEQYIQPS